MFVSSASQQNYKEAGCKKPSKHFLIKFLLSLFAKELQQLFWYEYILTNGSE